MTSKFNVTDIQWGEFDIEERNDYKFLREHSDAVLIGDGDNGIIVALNDKPSSNPDEFMKNINLNFDVYILRDDKKDEVEGPFKMLDLLLDCQQQQTSDD